MKGSQSYSFWVDLTTIVCLSNPSLSEREKTLLRPVAFPFLLKEWSKTKCLSQSALIVNTRCSLCWYFNLFFSSVLRILCFFQLQNIENCDNSFLYKAQYSCGSRYCLCVYICPVIVYNLCICLKAVFQHLYLKERLTTKQKRIAEHLTFTCSIQYSLCMQIWPAKVLLQKVNEVLNCLILKAVFFLLQLKLNEANSEFVTSKGLQFSFSYLNFFFFFPGNSPERPLHYTENVLEQVLHWSSLPEPGTAYLIIKRFLTADMMKLYNGMYFFFNWISLCPYRKWQFLYSYFIEAKLPRTSKLPVYHKSLCFTKSCTELLLKHRTKTIRHFYK